MNNPLFITRTDLIVLVLTGACLLASWALAAFGRWSEATYFLLSVVLGILLLREA